MNKNFFNPSRKDSMMLALMYILLGLALCLFSGGLLVTMIRIIGLIMIVYGAFMLYQYFGVRKSANTYPMIVGIPAVVFGLILAAWPTMIISFFPVVAGIALIFSSVVQIQKALMQKSAGYPNWMVTLVIALIMLAFGIVLVIRPMNIINMIIRIAGVGLIIEGCIILFESFQKN